MSWDKRQPDLKDLKRMFSKREDDKEIADRLRELGYIE